MDQNTPSRITGILLKLVGPAQSIYTKSDDGLYQSTKLYRASHSSPDTGLESHEDEQVSP